MINNNLKKTAILLIVFTGVFLLKTVQGDQTSAIKVTPGQTCTQWDGTGVQFRWCKDDDSFKNTSYQFYNGYPFTVQYFFKIEFTNGETFTGNSFLDAETQGGQGSMYKRIPEGWSVTKKRKQDSAGHWVDFN